MIDDEDYKAPRPPRHVPPRHAHNRFSMKPEEMDHCQFNNPGLGAQIMDYTIYLCPVRGTMAMAFVQTDGRYYTMPDWVPGGKMLFRYKHKSTIPGDDLENPGYEVVELMANSGNFFFGWSRIDRYCTWNRVAVRMDEHILPGEAFSSYTSTDNTAYFLWFAHDFNKNGVIFPAVYKTSMVEIAKGDLEEFEKYFNYTYGTGEFTRSVEAARVRHKSANRLRKRRKELDNREVRLDSTAS